MPRYPFTFVMLFVLQAWVPAALHADTGPFPVPVGLQGAVDFWKQIFTRYGATDVVLFDPLDPGTIYGVVRGRGGEPERALVEKERGRIVAEYDLADDESRIRSQRGAKDGFSEGLRISGRYMAQMQKIFRDEGLPAELAYLPLVESSFNVRARSSAGAVGMWQFIPETGKKFLRIDDKVDERRDPMASTRAAARLLKENYRILGSWPLALTAYNHGTEGIFRGISAVGSRDLVDLIRHYQSPTFGFASKNFYAEFLAVVDIASDAEKYFPFLRLHRAVTLREVPVHRAAPLQAVLKPAAISQGEFFSWNPALDSDIKSIPAGYRVNLPEDKVVSFQTAHARALTTPVKSAAGSARKSGAKPETLKPSQRVKLVHKAVLKKKSSAAAKARPSARTKDQVAKDLAARRSASAR